MPQPTLRTMTQEEYDAVYRLASTPSTDVRSAAGMAVWFGLMAVLGAAFVLFGVLPMFIQGIGIIVKVLLTVLFGAAVGILVYRRLTYQPPVTHPDNLYAEDLQARLVEEASYTATGALRLVEDEADQTEAHIATFVEVEGGQVLFLCGEYLYPLVESGIFPCRQFTVIRLPQAKEVLRIDCQGEPFPAETTTDTSFLDGSNMPEDGTTIPATLTTLAAVLDCFAKPAPH